MITTERLLLTPATEADIDIYQKLFTCPDTTRYLPGGKPFSVAYIVQYLSTKVAHWEKGFGTFIVSLRSDPTVKIGYAGVEMLADVNLCDIRYAIAAEHQGQGYAFEAANAALNFVFSNQLVDEVYGVAVSENHASLRLLRKLGMQETDTKLYDADNLVTLSVPHGSFTPH
ncbi:GNAT family N-acetyltransferase [Vibrio navarrensis]|nr:GNAT family N-acetyltransferase [Vibrio navarrensis]